MMGMIGSGALGLALLIYLKQVLSLRPNLNKLSFMGVLFLLTVALILAIFVMFWVQVKLITTLWILLAISPVAFVIINKALIEADCNIEEFKQKTK